MEIVRLAVEGDAYLALENLDGGGAVGVMLLHAGGVLHGDEDNSEVMLFEQSLGGVAGLPGFVLLGIDYLLEQVKMRQFVDHGAVSLRGCHVRRSFVVRKFTLSLKDESKRVEAGMDAVGGCFIYLWFASRLDAGVREAVSGVDQ